MSDDLDDVDIPEAAMAAIRGQIPTNLRGLVYQLAAPQDRPPGLAWAIRALHGATQRPPVNFLPLMPVDDRSFACVVCRTTGDHPERVGSVVRWHLDRVPDWAQAQVLDTSVGAFLDAAAAELDARPQGLRVMQRVAEEYAARHGADNSSARHFEERPIRLAVQNVVIGLAAIRHEAEFDGLAVTAWQTCHAPHCKF